MEKDITEEKIAKLLAPENLLIGSGSGSGSGIVKKLNKDITIMAVENSGSINYKSKYNIKNIFKENNYE